ncbi:MAG: UbiA family prenyltransferase [Firmicutes bacterium]|nr:UbiA family prenyltransferase [Bacillota bacterium]
MSLRGAFQKVLGPTMMAYVLHLRPLEWPIMTAHFLLGTFLAAGVAVSWKAVLLGWLVFVLLMNGGTLAINSAFDQDEGDVGYLKQPPKPPRYLFHVSAAMLLASLALGFLLPPIFAWSNAACVAMSFLYSVPPARLKARAGWDLLINCLGFGLLTPMAGWGLTGRPLTAPFLAVAIGFAFLFGALYPLTQIYQIDEDRRRGDRTLVILLGESRSLILALLLALLAHGCFGWALLRSSADSPWLLPSLAAWLLVLVPWLRGWRTWSASRHEKGMYHALAAWAVTDLTLLILLWPQC